MCAIYLNFLRWQPPRSHDMTSATVHVLIGTNREQGKADHIGVFESLIKGSVLAR